ncbi:MAG: AMP-binding protein [Methylococcales bacterium]|jgi:acyl-CoA synthetase (AMP-forming)/AMP-acid ligase II/3-hydroxymyristoyl/3-hydroxydecanoyl-(acyl carrier protein) dehydratase|nr:AMP-binding protein [Methylococcales bacterium]MBT7443210.1 AMP-binding protein [Methylococcales bacterium]
MSRIINIDQLLTQCADTKIIAVRAGRAITAAELKQNVQAAIANIQLRPEQKVALYCHDSVCFLVWFLALLEAQKSVVLVPNIQQDFLQAIEQDIECVVTDQPFKNDAITVYDAELNCNTEGEKKLGQFTLQSEVVLFTSGSTGTPKKICKQLQQLNLEIATLESLWGDDIADSMFYATVSHQHIYGLLFRVLWPVCTGRRFDAFTYPYPESLFEQMANTASVLVSSPAQLKRIPDLVNLNNVTSQLNKVFSSGGPLDKPVAQCWLSQLGQEVVEIFGSSETGGVAHRCNGTNDISGWRALPNVNLKTNDVGMLYIQSPYEGSGQWVEMGDRVDIHEDGLFTLMGRADRIVKLEEKRLSLNEVEQVLQQSSLVAECRAIVTQGRRLQLSLVVVLSREGQSVLSGESKRGLNIRLKKILSRYFEPVLLPRRWRYVNALPMNEQGKVTEQLLTQCFDPEPVLLPEILSSKSISADQYEYQLKIPASLLYFKGHFEGRPILPGVVQVHWVIGFARELFELKPAFTHLEAVKFYDFIKPDMVVDLTLQYLPDKGVLKFFYKNSKAKLSSGKVVWQ